MDRLIFKRKEDDKTFYLLNIKHFTLNAEVKETGQHFGIPANMYIFKSDDGEVDIELFSKINERFIEENEK